MKFKQVTRIAAALTLVLYAVLIVMAVQLIALNFLYSVLLCVTLALLAYAIWLSFCGTGAKHRLSRWLLAGASIALFGEIIYFTMITNILAVAVFVLLVILYVLLVALLRNSYWQESRIKAENMAGLTHFERPYLIINPKSGNGRAIKAHVDRLATQQGINVMMLHKGDDVASKAQEAVHAGADVLGISGGDGSIGAVAKIAIENELPMVVLPGGTRCHFARDLGLDPKKIGDALAGFRGVERRVDAGEINGRIFLNNASFGLYADIVGHPDYRGNKRRVTREVLQEVASGEKPAYALNFKHGKKQFKKAVMVLVGVNAYDMSNIFEMGRREHLDAGKLQITSVIKLDVDTMQTLLQSVRNRNDVPDIAQWESKSFKVSAPEKKLVAGVDGERETYRTPVNIRILPKALRLYVPAEGVRSRPHKAFSGFMVRRLWDTALHGSNNFR